MCQLCSDCQWKAFIIFWFCRCYGFFYLEGRATLIQIFWSHVCNLLFFVLMMYTYCTSTLFWTAVRGSVYNRVPTWIATWIWKLLHRGLLHSIFNWFALWILCLWFRTRFSWVDKTIDFDITLWQPIEPSSQSAIRI